MTRKPDRKGLGRGLSALLADTDSQSGETSAPQRSDMTVPLARIHPNPDQPRRRFAEAELDDLSRSIAQKGILQPLIVRPDPTRENAYQIVAGERRWRAAQRAQLHDIPVIIRELDDTEVLELAIIENIQRADLNPVEEASGYRQLMDRFGHTQDQLATALGKSRSHIANLLRLLTLPDPVLAHLREGRLSAGHARALITAPDPAALAQIVIDQALSVRQTEALARKAPEKAPAKQRLEPRKDADTRAIESELSATLKMSVSIDHTPGQEGGALKIRYANLDQLDALLERLSN